VIETLKAWGVLRAGISVQYGRLLAQNWRGLSTARA
jgi:hypothetical protein